MNPLKQLETVGQSPWLDYVKRSLIEKGELKTLIERDGLKGVTSNPSIFEKAIGESDEYVGALKAFQGKADHGISAIYEHLAIADIRAGADVLRPVYEASGGRDGYISLECSPYLANDTEATIDEALRLWSAVGRPNLMVKVPATEAGIPAIRQLIGRGLNINVTLLFGVGMYERVVDAYIAGLEDLARAGGDVSRTGSVASFFVSRIDTAVDKELDRIGDKGSGRAAARQDCDRECQARLCPLQGAVRRPALAGAGGGRGEDAAAAMGIDQHQESGVSRHALCRAADRPRHGEHDAAGDDGCVPRPRRDHPRRGRARSRHRGSRSRGTGKARHLARCGDDEAGRGRRAAVRRCLRRVAGCGRAAAPHAVRRRSREPLCASERRRARARDWRGDGGLAQGRSHPPAMGRGRVAVDRARRGAMDRLAARRRAAASGRGGAAELRWRGARQGLHRCRAARHGRIEPRAGGAGAGFWPAAGLAAISHPRQHRSGADPHPRCRDRRKPRAVRRAVEVGQHPRTQYLHGAFP